MRCLMCESFSFIHICSACQELYLQPKLFTRKLPNNIEVVSFYKYKEIKELLHTKHTDLGFYIYKILANNSMKLFAKNFNFENTLYSVAVDDAPKGNYSHTAILNNSLHSKHIKPLHAKLRASNTISYSGKSKLFREQNPREFQMKHFTQKEIMIVDDIITTGSTLTQASQTLQAKDKNILFCLTLADASRK